MRREITQEEGGQVAGLCKHSITPAMMDYSASSRRADQGGQRPRPSPQFRGTTFSRVTGAKEWRQQVANSLQTGSTRVRWRSSGSLK